MSKRLFGTDGIRGTANIEPMTAETALRVAQAAGLQFTRGDHRHTVVIGKDTRLSGYMIESALQAGFVSMGMDVVLLGPLPTPAVAMLTRSLRADVGVMVSASHNPYRDNGIKLFGPDGYKLSDAVEMRIEALVRNGLSEHLPDAHDLGQASRLNDAAGRYMEAVKLTFPRDRNLDGIKIVVDCAHGAAYKVAPTVLWELGADVVAIGDNPNGRNINLEVGATAPAALSQRVVEEGADLGIALDGDADRLILVDETGRVIDGDQVMALIGRDWAERGRLKHNRVVATIMSNLGLERFLGGVGVTLDRTKVGDRYVVEHMRANGLNVGGEQSGHIVLSDYATTGDGLLAALQVLAVYSGQGKPMSVLADAFEPVPQLLKNARYPAGTDPLSHPKVTDAIKGAEAMLRNVGRLVIRKSGTEPLVRVMAEADDPDLVAEAVDHVIAAIADLPDELDQAAE